LLGPSFLGFKIKHQNSVLVHPKILVGSIHKLVGKNLATHANDAKIGRKCNTKWFNLSFSVGISSAFITHICTPFENRGFSFRIDK